MPAAASPAADIRRECARLIVSMQEKERDDEAEPAQWPYEGVYRVEGEIPVGYRVGGTAICAESLVLTPGYDENEEARAAVTRALRYLCDARRHPLMSFEDYDAGYDVRTWGAIYALDAICLLKQRGAIPVDLTGRCADAAAWYLEAIIKTEIPEVGGWNYARPPGRDKAAPPSPFMTASAVQALLRAKSLGMDVEAGVMDRAIAALEQSRTDAGAVAYAGDGGKRPDLTPGAVGRMCAVEATLMMAGRGDPRSVRGAVDSFFTHWHHLEARRQKTGTHVGPYGVAPYYFMFAHHAAAQCIELLPRRERAEYRRRLEETLLKVRDADGGWNDRVFKRSSAYGTAMASLCLGMPEHPPETTGR